MCSALLGRPAKSRGIVGTPSSEQCVDKPIAQRSARFTPCRESRPRPNPLKRTYRSLMNSRVILVSDDRSSLRSPGTLLWPDAAGMRGIHTGEWAAHIFEYAISFEGNMTQVRELAATNGVGVLHPHGTLPPSRLASSSATSTRPSHALRPSTYWPSVPGKPTRSVRSPPALWPENWTSQSPYGRE